MLIKHVAHAKSWTTIRMWLPHTEFFLYALKKTPKSDNLYLCRVYLPLQHGSIIIHHLSWSPSRSKSTATAANMAILNNTIPYFVTSYWTLYCNYGLYIEVTFSYMVVQRIEGYSCHDGSSFIMRHEGHQKISVGCRGAENLLIPLIVLKFLNFFVPEYKNTSLKKNLYFFSIVFFFLFKN